MGISGNLQRACTLLVEDRAELRVRLLHEAINGLGTNFQKIVDVLVPLEADQMEAVKTTYEKLYGKKLKANIEGCTSGNKGFCLCRYGRKRWGWGLW